MKKAERELMREIRSLRSLLAYERKDHRITRDAKWEARKERDALQAETVITWAPNEKQQSCSNDPGLGDFDPGDTILIVGEVLETSKCRQGNSTVTYNMLRTERRRKKP